MREKQEKDKIISELQNRSSE